MGNGEFAYYNGFIYFAPPGNMIAEVDLTTMKVTTLETADMIWMAGLSADEEYVYYRSLDNYYKMTPDGKNSEVISHYSDPNAAYRYNDGKDSFYIQHGILGDFYHEDLETGEVTMLMEFTKYYYVDEDYVYVIAKDPSWTDTTRLALYRSERDKFDFKKIKLDLEPLAMVIQDGVMYLNQARYFGLRYLELEEISDLEQNYQTNSLPINTLTFQPVAGKIFYVEDAREETMDMRFYDLETGEISDVIFEDVYVFCVVADRYVCVHTENSMGIYDAVKGEHLQFLVTE